MTSDSERKSVKATVTPRKDNTGPKPLLTRREIEASKIRSDLNPAWCRTIEAMAKLLEQTLFAITPEEKRAANLAVAIAVRDYNATGGEGS